MKPPVPEPRDLAQQRFRWCALDWLEAHDEPDRAPDQARNLLAAWAGLSRIIDPSEWLAALVELTARLQHDAAALLNAFLDNAPPAEWLQDAAELDTAWETLERADLISELDSAAAHLFDKLDEHQLAVLQARRLAEQSGAATEQLRNWQRQLDAAEDFLADHADCFLPAAPSAAVLLDAFRPDLDELDYELWLTTLKHRRLEELEEELEAAPSLVRPTLPRPAAIVKVRRNGREFTAHTRDVLPQLRLAAAAAPEAMQLTQRLWRSPDGTSEACLTLPTAGPGPARLAFYGVVDRQPPAMLANRPVILAGREGLLNDRVLTDFAIRELLDANEPLWLEVDGVPWEAAPAIS